jgi:DNA-binding MarR family transcriptional regulator
MSAAPAQSPVLAPVRSDEELAVALRIAVTRLHRRLRQQSLGDLTPAQSSALASVHHLGAPTLGELSEREQVQPPTMTRVVTALEAAGLVVREVDAQDRRVVRVRLTPAGRRTIQRVRGSKTAYLARRIDALSSNDRRALDSAVRLIEHLVEE